MFCFILLTAKKQTYKTKFARITLVIEFLTENNYNTRHIMNRVVLGNQPLHRLPGPWLWQSRIGYRSAFWVPYLSPLLSFLCDLKSTYPYPKDSIKGINRVIPDSEYPGSVVRTFRLHVEPSIHLLDLRENSGVLSAPHEAPLSARKSRLKNVPI